MLENLKKNFYMIRFAIKFAPETLFFKIILAVTNIIINVMMNVAFFKYVVDAMQYGGDFMKVVVFIGWGSAVIVIDGIFASIFYSLVDPIAHNKIHKGMHNMIFAKIRTVDLEKYDDSAFYDDYIWALNEADNCVNQSYNIIFSFFTNIINTLIFSGISIAYEPSLIVFSVVPLVVNILASNKESVLQTKKQEEIVPPQRRASYSQRVMYLQQYAKELRLYPSMNDKTISEFDSAIDRQIEITKKYSPKFIVTFLLKEHFRTIFSVLLMALYVSYKVIVKNEMSAGTFVAMFTAINNFAYSIGAIFNAIPQITKNGLYSEKVINILNYKSEIEKSDEVSEEQIKEFFEAFEKIEFKNVSFKYTGSEDYVIKNLSFTVNKTDKIAFVGINGAGKTTIIKLILRLYDPTEGSILINGRDIKNMSSVLYRKIFQVVFQDYQLYAYTLSENILMGNCKNEDKPLVYDALKKSQIPEFSDKADCLMTKEFDSEGIMPSGGQSQKIAVARAFAHTGKIMIMDEASSALDPISEYNINKSIIDMAKGKGLVIVSHRLSTIQYVDRIYYLENGTIAEEGSHSELISLGGGYANMYETQAESYRLQ